MKAINKYIIIKTVDEEVKTSSGFFLSAKESDSMRYKKGVVVEPGSNVETIKSGDEILYDKARGFTIIIDGETYTIIVENDVIVVL
jgi:co-chaperonin GroES (HSP10)